MFITASIGIAVGLEEPDVLLRNADLAMYEAKGQGKGRYEIFQRHMHEALAQRLDLELDLKRAARCASEFVAPLPADRRAGHGEVVGVEALIRWKHPDRGPDPPRPVHPDRRGERTDPRARPLGAVGGVPDGWSTGRTPTASSGSNVNISGAQLRQASLVREVGEILEATGLEPERLTLEITESVLMEVSSSNTERLDALEKLGVQLAVDDFGTGYSSLQYLKRFPVDWLKIAKPFVDGVGDSDAQARIARAIVDLAHSLEIEVIARESSPDVRPRCSGSWAAPTARAFTTRRRFRPKTSPPTSPPARSLASRFTPRSRKGRSRPGIPIRPPTAPRLNASCQDASKNSAARPASAASAVPSATRW